MGVLDRLHFRALDSDFNTMDIIDAHESIIWTDKYNEVGDFEIFGSINQQLISVLINSTYIFNSETSGLMVVENPGLEYDIEAGDTLTIKGRAMESVLDRRVIPNTHTIFNSTDTKISQIVCDLVTSAFGNPADTDRYWDMLVIIDETSPISPVLPADTGLQFTIGENLLDVVTNLCQSAGLGFKCEFSPVDMKVNFIVYEGVDRSMQGDNLVIFADTYDNLITGSDEWSTSGVKDTALIIGSAKNLDETPKLPQIVSSGTTGLDRRETFIQADISDVIYDANGDPIRDMTDAEYIAALQQRGADELLNPDYQTIRSYNGEIVETISCRYGVNFNLGDIVLFRFPHLQFNSNRLTGITFSDDINEGKKLIPTFESL